MPPINPEKVAEYIRTVSAERIEPRFRMLAEHEISTKTGPTDLVTVADIEAEEELTRIFEDLIPGSHVIGEEAVSNETTDMGLLKTETGYIWVVDPVDGTGNFANGDSKFGTIVTLVKNGESIQGWIYDSQYNRMAITEKGGGVQINGVSKTYPAMTDSLQESRGFISRKFLPSKMRRELKDVLDTEFGKVDTYLCCAHEYLDILDGKSFFSLYSRIRPWDHLTGTMMMSEAGGYVRKWDGSEYGPGDERGGVICAQDRDTWDNIYDLLLKRYLEEAA